MMVLEREIAEGGRKRRRERNAHSYQLRAVNTTKYE